MKEIRLKLKVRSYEVDSLGHVNHSVYLNYLEHARAEFLRMGGFPLEEMVRDGLFPVMVNININYRKPAFIADELEVIGNIVKVGRSSITEEIKIYNMKTNDIVCESTDTYVFVNGHTNKPVSIPKGFKEAFELDSL